MSEPNETAAPAIETVRMIRAEPTATGPNRADVHPLEVAGYEAAGWIVGDTGDGEDARPQVTLSLPALGVSVVVFDMLRLGGSMHMFTRKLTDADHELFHETSDPASIEGFAGTLTEVGYPTFDYSADFEPAVIAPTPPTSPPGATPRAENAPEAATVETNGASNATGDFSATDDSLDAMTKVELETVAKTEGVDAGKRPTKDALVAAIRSSRAAAALKTEA